MGKKNVPAKKPEGGGAIAAYDYGEEHAGAGLDNITNEDLAIPFLGVLQTLSPQVSKKEKKIEGAEPGMLINTVSEEITAADIDEDGEGVVIVPCLTEHIYTEWVPRDAGGGFAGRHDIGSELVQHCRANQKFGEFKTEAGNDLVETFYLYCLLLDSADAIESASPIILGFTSTKIKKYKTLMSKIRMMKGQPPLYAFKIRVRTKGESRPGGDSFNFMLDPVNGSLAESMIDPGSDQANLLTEGKSLLKAIKGGTAKAAYDSQDGAGAADPEGDGTPPF